jgi:hypothetical protein
VVPDGFPRGCLAPLQFQKEYAVTDAPADLEREICSAKRCQEPATWELLWNNPKLHTPERRKVWLACDDHKQSLSDFLGARQFLKDVVSHR